MNLWLAIPSYSGEVCEQFSVSLKQTVELLKKTDIELVNVDTISGCCYIPLARNRLAKIFLESQADTIMFLDADLSWKPEQMVSFLQTEACFLAGVYPKKARVRDYPCQLYCDAPDYLPVVKNGLIKASDVPTGFLRLNREVFELMLEYYGEELEIDEPDPDDGFKLKFSYWNFFDCVKIGRRWVGEDFNFCRIWRGLGGDIWIYPDITFGHWVNNGSGVIGNYHDYLLRQPGGLKAGPVKAEDYPGNDLEGFMTPAELQFLYQESSKYESVVEIGSYKGRSAHAYLSGLAKHVTCIDPWQYQCGKVHTGDAEFEEFCRNVEPIRGGNGRLKIIRNTSLGAVNEVGLADMVFIDGDHEYESVKADIAAWLPKTKKIISGHDYVPGWPGVVRAVDETFGDKVKQIDSIWYVELGE